MAAAPPPPAGLPQRGDFLTAALAEGRDSRPAGAGGPEPAAVAPQAGSEGGVKQGRAGTAAGPGAGPLAATPRGLGAGGGLG